MISPIFTYHFQIKEQDLDYFQHVNHAHYLTYFEEARWELLVQNGVSLPSLVSKNLGVVILRVELVFRRELGLRDNCYIQTYCSSYIKKIATVHQKLFKKKSDGEDELSSELKLTMGLFDLKLRKLIVPTQEFLHGMGIE